MVSAFPDISVERIQPDCDVKILACDGISDCLSSQEAVTLVSKELRKKRDKVSPLIEDMFDSICAKSN